MIKRIEIELNNGKKYILRGRDELVEINCEKTCIFLFNNGQIFEGMSDGVIETDDDEELFCIKNEKSKFRFAMPYYRLIGWNYK